MTTKVNKTIMVNVPVSTAYRQWTKFEEFPHFMGGVERVTRLSEDRLEWVAEIAGVHRRWEAKIVQQDVDRAVAWAAVEGAKNAGWVDFKEAGPSQTSLHLSLEYEPHGVLEFLGDKLHIVERQAESDLKKFKEYIEKQAPEAGTDTAERTTAGTTATATGATAATGASGTTGSQLPRTRHRSSIPSPTRSIRPTAWPIWTATPTRRLTATPAAKRSGRQTKVAARDSSHPWAGCRDSGKVPLIGRGVLTFFDHRGSESKPPKVEIAASRAQRRSGISARPANP